MFNCISMSTRFSEISLISVSLMLVFSLVLKYKPQADQNYAVESKNDLNTYKSNAVFLWFVI